MLIWIQRRKEGQKKSTNKILNLINSFIKWDKKNWAKKSPLSLSVVIRIKNWDPRLISWLPGRDPFGAFNNDDVVVVSCCCCWNCVKRVMFSPAPQAALPGRSCNERKDRATRRRNRLFKRRYQRERNRVTILGNLRVSPKKKFQNLIVMMGIRIMHLTGNL